MVKVEHIVDAQFVSLLLTCFFELKLKRPELISAKKVFINLFTAVALWRCAITQKLTLISMPSVHWLDKSRQLTPG